MQYAVIRNTTELEAFAPEWRELWPKDPQATPFQTPEWLIPWWRQFGQPELRCVTIRQDGELIGFVPFYRYENQLLLVGVGTTDYLGGVFSPECTPQDVKAAFELLAGESLYASQLQADSLLLKIGVQPFETEHCSRMPAALIGELPVKIRRNAMYYRNRAMRIGNLELTVANESNWVGAFDALQRLHTVRWESSGESGVLVDERVLAWHREAIPLLQRSGLLRLCCLRLNGEIIGVLYSLIAKRTQYFYITAYSVEHADLRPGTLLLALAIDCAKQEGFETIDMLRGDEAYKKIWHLIPEPTYGFRL